MTRALLPGRWNRHGRAVPDAQVSELDCDLALDAMRVFPAPKRQAKREPIAQTLRKAARMERVLLVGSLSLIAFGVIVLSR